MSEKEISIKINICDRYYPLRIQTSEEESIRKAANAINEKVKSYVANYSLQDKQDALSMVSLELASESKETESDQHDWEAIYEKMKSIEQLLAV